MLKTIAATQKKKPAPAMALPSVPKAPASGHEPGWLVASRRKRLDQAEQLRQLMRTVDDVSATADEFDRLYLLVESARGLAWAIDNGLEPDDISDGHSALFELLDTIHRLLWTTDINEVRTCFQQARSARIEAAEGGAR